LEIGGTTMQITIKFNKPIGGYWDGGLKSGGTFEVNRFKNLSNKHTCFGCWALNHYFNVKTGRTDKETISRAKRHLKKHCRQPFTFVN
jgi:hypothetical protein